MQLWDTQARANSARATPQEDQELIRTLDLSLLARKNSFWSFAIRRKALVLILSMWHSVKLFPLTEIFHCGVSSEFFPNDHQPFFLEFLS